MKIEFLPWYKVNNEMLRCDGADGCGALVMSDDAEKHLAWHKRISQPVPAAVTQQSRRTAMADLMCSDPTCPRPPPHRKHLEKR